MKGQYAMKRNIALLLVFVMLLLAACETAQLPADGTTPSTSATTPSGTEATQDDTTGAAEDTTQQPSTDGTTTSTEDGAAGSTEPSTKPTEPTKPTGGNSSTDGTEQPTTQPTQPTQQPTQPPTQPPQPTEGTKPSDPPAPSVNLSLDKTDISLDVGKTETITATYSGASGTPTWNIDSGSNVVAISGSGKSITVTAKAAGTAIISAHYGGKTAQCAVTVTNPAPTVGTLTINTPANTVVYVGETLQLNFSYTGDKSTLDFVSLSTSILTVTDDGLVLGKSAGAAIIEVYCGDTYLNSVRIKVENKSGGSTGPAAEKIVLDSTTAPWKGVAGNYMEFTAHAKTSGDPQTVTASSSNTSVATVSLVSTSGSNWCTFKVSFKGGGSTTITITSKDGKASTSYTVNVSGSYSCNPGGGQLTPEQWAYCATQVMVANGITESKTSSYTVATLSASELTWSTARNNGEYHARRTWTNGRQYGSITYEGVNEDGLYVFYLRN